MVILVLRPTSYRRSFPGMCRRLGFCMYQTNPHPAQLTLSVKELSPKEHNKIELTAAVPDPEEHLGQAISIVQLIRT